MRFSIATKIFLAFTAMLVTFSAVLGFNLYQMRAIHEEVALINGGYVPLSMALGDIKTDLRTYNVLLGEREWEVLRRTMTAIAQHYDFPEQIDIKLGRAQGHVTRLRAQPLNPRDAVFLDRLHGELREMRQLNDDFGRRSRDFSAAVLQARQDDAEAMQRELRTMARRLESRLRASQQTVREEIDTSLLRAQRSEQRSIGGALVLSVIALILSAGLMLVVHFTIRPLGRLTEGAKRIAGGDYRPVEPVPTRDEIGVLAREFNAMVETLADRDAAVREKSEKLEQAYADLTRINARLVALRNFNEDILNSVNTAIVAIGPEGRVTAANRTAERLFAPAPDARLAGAEASSLAPLRAIDRGDDQIMAVMQEGAARQHEAVSVHLPGAQAPVLLDLLLLPLKAGAGAEGHEITGALVVCDDVTERVQTREALVKSERLAAVGEIATKVAHELRNPLSTVRLNSELLADELEDHGVQPDSEPQATLRNIIAEVERLTALTEDYLRFARLPDPNPVPGDLVALVEDVLDFQRDELEWNGVEIIAELPQGLPPVRMDEAQLRRALLNLVRNAREAMEEGPRRVLTLRAWADLPDAETPRVHLEIGDTGVGIEPEALGRIFDPFFSTKAQGTGLGLPLTHQIVEEHHGALTCTSTPGQGTTFCLSLDACAPGTDHAARA